MLTKNQSVKWFGSFFKTIIFIKLIYNFLSLHIYKNSDRKNPLSLYKRKQNVSA